MNISIAIIGAGIAGASAARALALSMPEERGRISLYEIGRGPGGRASTRKTRAIPELGINHGAPYADITTREGLDLIASLGDTIKPYTGIRGFIDGQTGVFQPQTMHDGEAFIIGQNNEMANIAGAMLVPGINTEYSTMVRGFDRHGSGDHAQWVLSDKTGAEVGRADWLLVSGSGIAHPRWADTFGGEPPLVAAAARLHDPQLNDALAIIAQQNAAPVLVVLLCCTGDVADQWLRLGFNDAVVKDHDGLSKISIQPTGSGGCSVVLYSTIGYARKNTGVHGSSSSAARVGDAVSDSAREDHIIDEMLDAVVDIPSMPALKRADCVFGPLLHRWGNAFPQGEPMPQALTVCPNSKVAFCGDYVSTDARMGSVECALLSGMKVARALTQH